MTSKPEPVTGDCRLCGSIGVPLMDSHVMPKWTYRRMRDGTTDPIRIEGDVAIRTSTQVKEYMLCGSCEQLLGRDEDYVSKLALQDDDKTLGLALAVPEDSIRPEGRHIVGGAWIRTAPISHLDCAALARFSASVFWRAHVSTDERLKTLHLWKHQAEALRCFVLGKRVLPRQMCLAIMVPVEGAFTFTSPISDSLLMPVTRKQGEDSAHEFMVPGLVFTLTTGASSKPGIPCLVCSASPYASFLSWQALGSLRSAAQAIRTAEPRGKLTRVPRARR